MHSDCHVACILGWLVMWSTFLLANWLTGCSYLGREICSSRASILDVSPLLHTACNFPRPLPCLCNLSLVFLMKTCSSSSWNSISQFFSNRITAFCICFKKALPAPQSRRNVSWIPSLQGIPVTTYPLDQINFKPLLILAYRCFYTWSCCCFLGPIYLCLSKLNAVHYAWKIYRL